MRQPRLQVLSGGRGRRAVAAGLVLLGAVALVVALTAGTDADVVRQQRAIPWKVAEKTAAGRIVVLYPTMRGPQVATKLVGRRVQLDGGKTKLTLVEELTSSTLKQTGVYFDVRSLSIRLPSAARGRPLLPGRVDPGLEAYRDVLRDAQTKTN